MAEAPEAAEAPAAGTSVSIMKCPYDGIECFAPGVCDERLGCNYMRRVIEAHRTPRGGFSRKSAELLGVPWPLRKGWLSELIGRRRGAS